MVSREEPKEEKKEFDKISAQDIADAATINRATFYDHYTDKFSLLECMVGSRFHDLVAERDLQFDATCQAALQAIVMALCDYLARMQGADCKRELEPHMETASWAIYGAVKEWVKTPDRRPPEEIAKTVMTLVAPIFQQTK